MPHIMITFIGNSVADILIKPFDSLPSLGHLNMVEKIQLGIGGCAANPAVILGRIGVRVSLLCGVGDDNMGEFLLGELRKANVILDGVRIIPETATSVSVVFVRSNGERSFLTQFGTSKRYGIEQVSFEIIKNSSHIHYGGFFTLTNLVGARAAELFREAKKYGLTTSLDTAWDQSLKWLDGLSEVLPYTDYLMTNRMEGEMLTREDDYKAIAKVLHGKGTATVIIKLDKDGCYIYNNDVQECVPPYCVEVADTTGAGDAFAGGFVLGLSKGLRLLDCCKLANLFGAFCVGSLGTTDAFKSRESILSFIREREPSLSSIIF